MQKYNKPKYDYKTLGINPFSISLEIKVKELELLNAYKKDGDEWLPVTNDIEDTSFTKMFITAERRIIVSNLSPAAKELYLWIMFEIDAGRDALWINKERYMLENHTSINTYKKALEDLIRYAIISQTVVQGVYWFNPDFFFRGDRIKKYPKNLKYV
jgi:hypothetical protein